MKKVLIVFGTRPEAIKLVSIIKELQENSGLFEVKICVTGQHRQMLDHVLRIFEIRPDFDLNIMQGSQDLYDITAKALLGLKTVFAQFHPDLVLVQGDTTTALAASLASFYEKIRIGHVEAGLRTGNLYSPWPEELNRQLITRIAEYHFAPTPLARENLLLEKVPPDRILVSGNTVIDALLLVLDKIKNNPVLEDQIQTTIYNQGYRLTEKRFLLVTGHRRENFGRGLKNICTALQKIAAHFPEIEIVYPAHFNPNVCLPVKQMLGGLKNIYVIDPLEYAPFIYLMSKSHLILTDSGGIQEEAPSLGKPVLVMRETTERPEAVISGNARLVGTDPERIFSEAQMLLNNPNEYTKMSIPQNPFGHGAAGRKIVEFLINKSKQL